MFLGDIHCLSHAPFEQTFTIHPQNWQLLCLSVLEACMLNVWDWGQQHARTVWLLPLYLALNMKLRGKNKPTMAKFVSIPFLAVQVPFWCLLTTAKQKEWQIISEKGYGFPWIISSSRLLCRWTVPKVAWKASVSLCILIICELLVIPEFSVEFITWIPAVVSRNMYSTMYLMLLNSQNHTHSQNSMTGDVENGLVKLAMLSLVKSTQFSRRQLL